MSSVRGFLFYFPENPTPFLINALFPTVIQVLPLIASQNNPIQTIFHPNGDDTIIGLENVFRFIALCINIGGLYQEPSRIHFWRAHRIKGLRLNPLYKARFPICGYADGDYRVRVDTW